MKSTLLILLFSLVVPTVACGQSAVAVDYGQSTSQNPVGGAGPMPLPAFTSTYKYTHTRGFWFKVPCPLIITAWEVPDEAKQGKMNIAIYKMTAAPPAYSTSRPETPIYFRSGATSGKKVMLSPPLMFKPGDFLGVLGACGPDTQGYLHNSYGSGGFKCNLGTATVTLQRFLMQHAINANNGVGPVSSGGASTIARVKLEMVKSNLPTLTTSNLPRLGSTAVLDLTSNLTGATAGLVALGRGRTNKVLPLGTILANFPYLFLFPVAGGTGKVNLPIPNTSVLMGAGPINFQGFIHYPTNFGMTNGVEWRLGN